MDPDFKVTSHHQSVLEDPFTGRVSNINNTQVDSEDELDELLSAITPPPVKCEDIWFDDGNIILHINNTIFRVHKSVLVKHSSVWKTMASLPQSGHSGARSISIVALHDDVQDMKELLMVFYNPLYFMYSRDSFRFLAGILRLSTKYDIPHLQNESTVELQRVYPRHLKDFDCLNQTSSTPEADATISARTRAWAENYAIEAVNLARETSCMTILPCALYHCARLPVETIICGTSKARLPPEDVDTCMLGRETLLRMQRESTHPFLYTLPPVQATGKYPSCSDGACVRGGHKTLLRYIMDEMYFTTPIALEKFTKWLDVGRCISCAAPLQAAHLKAREVVWEELPNVFGLGVWEDLKGEDPCTDE
ncbi:hypothetical protein BJ138DRAFT_209656 [Hygrophoropsis aurantiaca]|uniref:Uncharacterized protein n=1 Tax=Hygrophoropsis aurantiaca TaxID=72124 RepID=A0ACB8A8T9_9AGAM|nr:hypothetical protein BJ138DRAFT_209656 [Hygrophoropsis aurantiaca]